MPQMSKDIWEIIKIWFISVIRDYIVGRSIYIRGYSETVMRDAEKVRGI